MTPSTTVLASVFDDDGRCICFVLKRGLAGFEAFTTAERSLGRSGVEAVMSAAQNSFF